MMQARLSIMRADAHALVVNLDRIRATRLVEAIKIEARILLACEALDDEAPPVTQTLLVAAFPAMRRGELSAGAPFYEVVRFAGRTLARAILARRRRERGRP